MTVKKVETEQMEPNPFDRQKYKIKKKQHFYNQPTKRYAQKFNVFHGNEQMIKN